MKQIIVSLLLLGYCLVSNISFSEEKGKLGWDENRSYTCSVINYDTHNGVGYFNDCLDNHSYFTVERKSKFVFTFSQIRECEGKRHFANNEKIAVIVKTTNDVVSVTGYSCLKEQEDYYFK